LAAFLVVFLLVVPMPGRADPITPRSAAGVPFCGSSYCGWDYANVPTSFSNAQTSLRSVIYVNPTTLVAVGDTGSILRSADGGLNWSMVPSPLPSTVYFKDVIMDPAGLVMAGGWNGTIIASPTSGASWEVWPSHGLLGNISQFGFATVTFGYAATSSGFFETHDGYNWTQLTLPSQGPGYSVAFSSESTGWVDIGAISPQVYYTTNGGSSWTKLVMAGFPQVFTSTIVVTGPTSAWILGYQGTVWVVTHGTHSNSTRLTTSQHTWTLAVVSGKYGWVSSDDANTFFTSDGGNIWLEEGVPQIPEVYGMAFTDPNDGVAVGDGVIWYTNDAGLGGNDSCGMTTGNFTGDVDSVPIKGGIASAVTMQSFPDAGALCFPNTFPDLRIPMLIVPALSGFVVIGVVVMRTNMGPPALANAPMPPAKELQEMKRRRKLRERHRYVRFR
jgi:photosystem II stability/assembly factor-like uncharacterized protein